MKFSGLACLDMKNICGKFRYKLTSMRKVIALAYVNPHLAYWLNDAYMRHLRIYRGGARGVPLPPKIFRVTSCHCIEII